jgi:hemerythrin-like domain-containing protein
MDKRTRREFVCNTAVAFGGLAFAPVSASQTKQPGKQKDAEVPPAEDLMREHGVLRRVLLIYEDMLRRMEGSQPVAPRPLAQAADIVRRFIEDYHEKQEEDFLFPRFQKAGKLTDLVAVLRQQHEVGRGLTRQILQGATDTGFRSAQTRQQVASAMKAFLRLYRPHAAREDTVLFPALHEVYSQREYRELGEQFEDRERKLFGENGFEKIVAQVADIEKTLGIFDLAQFSRPEQP